MDGMVSFNGKVVIVLDRCLMDSAPVVLEQMAVLLLMDYFQ